MNPVFISVDVEVTDTDPVYGRLMQVGMVSESGSELELVFPVKNTSKTSDWVHENLTELLEDCWRMYSQSGHLHPINAAGRSINAAFHGRVYDMHRWVMNERYVATSLEGRGNPDMIPSAVMVCYCGGLDFGFVARSFAHCGLDNPFHYEFVEISSLAMGTLGLPWGFKESELEVMLDIPPLEGGLKHNALEDAKHQLLEFQRLMEIDK